MRTIRLGLLSGVGLAASLAAFGQNGLRPGAPEFGTTPVYQRLTPMDFNKLTDQGVGGASWVTNFVPLVGSMTLYPAAFSPLLGAHTFASPHLPGGALVNYVELDYCDSNQSDKHVRLNVYDCDYKGACNWTPIATLVSTFSGSCSSTSTTLAYTVDNYLKELVFDVGFDEVGGSNALAGVIVGYKLQVSPAPASASFGDVATSNPQFQFVEALVAAGITAGCGGGNYCPNNPVTRGQMAVFLAKALGLNWSQ